MTKHLKTSSFLFRKPYLLDVSGQVNKYFFNSITPPPPPIFGLGIFLWRFLVRIVLGGGGSSLGFRRQVATSFTLLPLNIKLQDLGVA